MAKRKNPQPTSKAEQDVPPSPKAASTILELKVRFDFDSHEVFFALKDYAASQRRSANDQAIVLLEEILRGKGAYPRPPKDGPGTDDKGPDA